MRPKHGLSDLVQVERPQNLPFPYPHASLNTSSTCAVFLISCCAGDCGARPHSPCSLGRLFAALLGGRRLLMRRLASPVMHTTVRGCPVTIPGEDFQILRPTMQPHDQEEAGKAVFVPFDATLSSQ